MKKYISILLAAVLVLACLSACGTSDKPADADNSEKLSVVTTIFPQYDFTRQIVGDKADVTMLLQPGAESHSYEPTPQDIKTIQNCDLFIYTGGENDVWVDDILNSMGDQRPDTLRLIDCVPTVNEEIVEGMEHEHDHDHGEIVESEIKDRPLSDFAGDFQSVLPYFEDGTLDEYITEEAEENEKSFDEMKQEFLEKRKSDYNTLSIEGNSVSFHTPSGTVSAEYEYHGFQTVKDDRMEILPACGIHSKPKRLIQERRFIWPLTTMAPAQAAMKKNTRNTKKKSLISICAMVMKAWKLSWV